MCTKENLFITREINSFIFIFFNIIFYIYIYIYISLHIHTSYQNLILKILENNILLINMSSSEQSMIVQSKFVSGETVIIVSF